MSLLTLNLPRLFNRAYDHTARLQPGQLYERHAIEHRFLLEIIRAEHQRNGPLRRRRRWRAAGMLPPEMRPSPVDDPMIGRCDVCGTKGGFVYSLGFTGISTEWACSICWAWTWQTLMPNELPAQRGMRDLVWLQLPRWKQIVVYP